VVVLVVAGAIRPPAALVVLVVAVLRAPTG